MTAVRVGLALFAAWLAAVWHSSFTGQSLLMGMRPDLGILFVCLVSVRCRPGIGAAYGYLVGSLQGGAGGANFTAWAASRTLLGFACAWIGRSGIQLTPWVTAALVGAATIVAQGLLLLMAPTPDIGRFLGATLGTAIYNGVFAALLDALLRRTLDPRTD